MTKEEYQKNLIRLWDSLRTGHKGEKDCAEVGCSECPLYNEVGICNVYKSIEIVENWAKEHPIVTNADKFREVFGFEYDDVCDADNRFWNEEYNEKTKE